MLPLGLRASLAGTQAVKRAWLNADTAGMGWRRPIPPTLQRAEVVLVLVAFLVLGWLGLIAPLRWWAIVALLVTAVLVSDTARMLWPPYRSARDLWLWSAAFAAVVTSVMYATGWGPTLAVGYAFGLDLGVKHAGSRACLPMLLWSVVCLTLGQIAIAIGLAPTLVSSPHVHGLAVLVVLGVAIVVRSVWKSTRAKEDAEAEVRRREQRFEALVANASDIIVVFEPGGSVSYVSPAFERILGTRPDPDRLLGDDLVHPDDLRPAYDFFDRAMADPGRVHAHAARLCDDRGNWHWFEISVMNRLDDPHVRGVVANLRDVTDRKHYEAELTYHAFHDVLTGLPNRTAFVEHLELAVSHRRDDDHSLGLLFLDVDELKLVNDRLGHQAGDHLLRQVAVRLRSCMRPGDVVARFGGDEFAVLLSHLESRQAAERVADRVLEILRVPVEIEQNEFVVTSSIGIAVTTRGHHVSAEELLRQADLAMYVAKERGRGRWEFFDAGAAPQVLERLALEGELWKAVDEDELVVHFQPEVSLQTGELLSVEALVRWNHPQRGLLLPGTFVPVAEESNLILAVDRYVLRTACHQVRAWQELPPANRRLDLSVNLSPRFVRQPQAVEEVLEILRESQLDPSCLQLEITERTALSDDGSTLAALRSLRARGIRVAIDDFGTGYSSLSYLRRFPIDVLKLDKSFVDGLGEHVEPDAAIIQAVITLGHALGIRITAEGVERAEQAAELRALGCDTAQGFQFARPLDAVRLEAFLLGERVEIPGDVPAA